MEKFCQSCGMPLEKGCGTENDGSNSLIYCSYCYQKGGFTQPNIKNAKEMQKFCYKQMREQGMMPLFA
ncbi:MAG: zinc ribbon domain-containing protein [Brevinema sp.]